MSPELEAAIQQCYGDLNGATNFSTGANHFWAAVRLAIQEMEGLVKKIEELSK